MLGYRFKIEFKDVYLNRFSISKHEHSKPLINYRVPLISPSSHLKPGLVQLNPSDLEPWAIYWPLSDRDPDSAGWSSGGGVVNWSGVLSYPIWSISSGYRSAPAEFTTILINPSRTRDPAAQLGRCWACKPNIDPTVGQCPACAPLPRGGDTNLAQNDTENLTSYQNGSELLFGQSTQGSTNFQCHCHCRVIVGVWLGWPRGGEVSCPCKKTSQITLMGHLSPTCSSLWEQHGPSSARVTSTYCRLTTPPGD